MFASAETLAAILSRRMLSVTMLDGDKADTRATTLVCSAAYEKKLGGQEAVVVRGRTMRATQLMIIDEGQSAFAVSHEFGGKLIRIALPDSGPKPECDDYGCNWWQLYYLQTSMWRPEIRAASIYWHWQSVLRRQM